MMVKRKIRPRLVRLHLVSSPLLVLNYVEFTKYSTWIIFDVQCPSGRLYIFLSCVEEPGI